MLKSVGRNGRAKRHGPLIKLTAERSAGPRRTPLGSQPAVAQLLSRARSPQSLVSVRLVSRPASGPAANQPLQAKRSADAGPSGRCLPVEPTFPAARPATLVSTEWPHHFFWALLLPKEPTKHKKKKNKMSRPEGAHQPITDQSKQAS
jgi:hypothetical protein